MTADAVIIELEKKVEKNSKLESRVIRLEKDVEHLQTSQKQVVSSLDKLREDTTASHAAILESIGKVNDEQVKQDKKLSVMRGFFYCFVTLGGGTGATAVATDGDKIVEFLKHLVAFF